METLSEMRAKIAGKASRDEDFRARLLEDPKGAVEQELGVSIPASLSIEVHEMAARPRIWSFPPTAS